VLDGSRVLARLRVRLATVAEQGGLETVLLRLSSESSLGRFLALGGSAILELADGRGDAVLGVLGDLDRVVRGRSRGLVVLGRNNGARAELRLELGLLADSPRGRVRRDLELRASQVEHSRERHS
jgi:hypothetical protein